MTYDPSLTGNSKLGIFGLPFTEEFADLILLPVPWEVTTSYRSGTSKGPNSIFEASPQLDLEDLHWKNAWRKGIFYDSPFGDDIEKLNNSMKPLAQEIIATLENGDELNKLQKENLAKINQAGETVNKLIFERTKSLLSQNKCVGLVGGDHSSPLGLIKAIDQSMTDSFGILHIDAHADLRNAYQGFEYSHASIMNNVLASCSNIGALVQVGIRDFCDEEQQTIDSNPIIHCFYDRQLMIQKFNNKSWHDIVNEFINQLPEKVYVSCDIDGLDPELCPDTGTPVPGGLSFNEFTYILLQLKKSGKQIVGFDLCEVSPGETDFNEWNAIVGARVLFQLANATLSDRLYEV